MLSKLKKDPYKIKIFHELKKSKIYVGELIYDKKNDFYKLIYDDNYIKYRYAIPFGVGLELNKKVHTSKKGQLFPSFQDRIPLRENSAYPDYCEHMGISINETNPIILLATIGRRGPSTFIFEPVYVTDFNIENIIDLRKKLQISQADFAAALGIKKVTLQRIETRNSADSNTIKLLEIYFTFPEVAVWQLYQTGINVHTSVFVKMLEYFSNSK